MAYEDYARAEACNLSKGQVFSLAESIAQQIEFEPGHDINLAVEKLGGSIKVQDTLLEDPEQTGSLFVDAPANFNIIIPSHTSPRRDRFTIAHELGHYIVHYLLKKHSTGENPGKMMAFRKDSDRVEWEANWFAAAFLMPSQPFRAQFEECGGNLDAVSSHFGVSKAAAEVRARSLGL
jgi:Zn-dependent peptidase ImmA (M78 family)